MRRQRQEINDNSQEGEALFFGLDCRLAFPSMSLVQRLLIWFSRLLVSPDHSDLTSVFFLVAVEISTPSSRYQKANNAGPMVSCAGLSRPLDFPRSRLRAYVVASD